MLEDRWLSSLGWLLWGGAGWLAGACWGGSLGSRWGGSSGALWGLSGARWVALWGGSLGLSSLSGPLILLLPLASSYPLLSSLIL